jgi:hypothetical protein
MRPNSAVELVAERDAKLFFLLTFPYVMYKFLVIAVQFREEASRFWGYMLICVCAIETSFAAVFRPLPPY